MRMAKPAVDVAACTKFVMAAFFNDLIAVDDQDAVGIERPGRYLLAQSLAAVIHCHRASVTIHSICSTSSWAKRRR